MRSLLIYVFVFALCSIGFPIFLFRHIRLGKIPKKTGTVVLAQKVIWFLLIAWMMISIEYDLDLYAAIAVVIALFAGQIGLTVYICVLHRRLRAESNLGVTASTSGSNLHPS